jgi:hypothetical protein
MNEKYPSIIDELASKLTEIKDRIKGGTIDALVFEKLSNNAKTIQDKLNEMLQKKGFYTQSDINDAYATLQDIKRSELAEESKKAMKRLISYSGVGILVLLGIYIILKRKSND